jgi:hypothetical protein
MVDWKKAYEQRERELEKRTWIEGMALRDQQRREQKRMLREAEEKGPNHPQNETKVSEPAQSRSKRTSPVVLVLLIALGYFIFRAANPVVQESTLNRETTNSGNATADSTPSEPSARDVSKEAPAAVNTQPTESASSKTDPAVPLESPTSLTAAEISFPATHKHRLRDCHGILTLSKESIRYKTDNDEDSFEFRITEVSLHDDGIDAGGKRWHFEIPGQRAEDLFRNWKAGVLPH